MQIGRLVLSTVVTLSLTACAAKVPTSVLGGTDPKSKISIQFEGFPVDTVCQVVTPNGTVAAPSFPGRVEYPAQFREAPVTCTTPDNAIYDLLIPTVLPEGDLRVAGITAYLTGLLVSTVSGESLFQMQNEVGVVKRQ